MFNIFPNKIQLFMQHLSDPTTYPEATIILSDDNFTLSHLKILWIDLNKLTQFRLIPEFTKATKEVESAKICLGLQH